MTGNNIRVHALQTLHCTVTMAIVRSINFHGKGSGCSLRFLTRQIITLFYIFVVLAFIITVHGQIYNAQPQYMCNAYNYTNGSKFESNLNTVLNNLVRGASQTGFNTSVYGQIPEQIYGLLQCGGDATAQQCYNCSQKAIAALRQLCGNSRGGRVWLEDCYLRYENGAFLGKLSSDAKFVPSSSQNVSSPGVFQAALDRLLKNLSGEATSGSGYASGTTIDSLSRKIYGAVQCWKDISTNDCTKCLSSTINTIVTYYSGSQGVEGFIGSCKVRYETYNFFHSTAPPPSPADAPAISEPKQITPSSNTTQINYSGKASDRIPAIVGGALGSLLFVLVVCLFTYN